MRVNPANVIDELLKEFGRKTTITTNVEKELAQQIAGIIKARSCDNVLCEVESDLVFLEEDDDEDIDNIIEDFTDNIFEEFAHVEQQDTPVDNSSSSWEASQTTSSRVETINVPFSRRKRAVQFWRSSKNKKRKLSSVQKLFRFVKSEDQLKTWEKQISKDGPVHEKWKTVASYVRKQFVSSRQERKSVHDEHLKRWAVLEARKVGLINFKCSKHWIVTFKKHNRIVTRKITKFVTKEKIEKDINFMQAAENFVESVCKEFEVFTPAQVFNTDQSGFNLEMHGGRTLEHVGTRRVESIVQSESSLTHSYTIMPTLSASGELLSPMVVVLKEIGGKFGPNVEKTIFKAKNILSIAAKSSIMGKKEISIWYNEAFLPNCSETCMLLVDSLKAYSGLEDKSDSGKSVLIKTIPPHTTDLVQPLDVYFFRIWKSFVRKITDVIITEESDFILRQRNNILKLQSLVHNQLSSPIFKSFRLQAWYKAQYFKEDSPDFIHPITHCFLSDEQICSKCSNVKMLKCSWCGEILCVKHALVECHFHNSE